MRGMLNNKYSKEIRETVIKDYLRTKSSYVSLSKKYGINRSLIEKWIEIYKVNLIFGSSCSKKQKQITQEGYSKFFKEVSLKHPELQIIINEIEKLSINKAVIDNQTFENAKLGNPKAVKDMTNFYIRSVFKICYDFSEFFGCDIEDSVQNGFESLLSAIKSNPCSSRRDFRQYLSTTVVSRLCNYYDRTNAPYKISAKRRYLLFVFLKKHKNLIKKHGIENLLDYIPEEDFCILKNKTPFLFQYLYPNEPDALNEIPFYDNVEKNIDTELLKQQILEALEDIPQKERDILKLRFGIGCQCYTLQEVSDMFGFTKERIAQLERKALRRLRTPRLTKRLWDFKEYSTL